MKKVSILSGNFSAAGNYSGYNASGERVFIAKRQMAGLGFNVDSDVKFPFYALAQNKEYEEVDENNAPTGKTFTRLTAGSVFSDKTKMINASIEDRLLDIEAEVALKAQATSAGLTEAQLLALA